MTQKTHIPLSFGLFICFSLAISLWLVPVPSEQPVPDETPAFPWSPLSPGREKNPEKAFRTLMRLQPWGGENADSEASAPVSWGLKGLVSISGERFALIETGDNRVHRYACGDILPDGGILHAVGEDFVKVRIGEDTRVIRLYSK
ncbi:hypothetical protein QUF80_15665 [Desulfococcaceae bacterium HSG8]|nr:hypothetical protein [Desulfococcaceae bacterium HSG8]